MTDWPRTEAGAEPKLVSIDEIVDIKARRPAATTRQRGWRGVTVDLYPAQSDCFRQYPALDHHLIGYCVAGSAQLVQRRDGAVHRSLIAAGTSLLMPAGYASVWEGDTAVTARLRVPLPLLAAAAEEMGRRAVCRVEIRSVFETRDPILERLAQVLLAELERAAHPAQALIVDQVSCALAAHLLRDYNLLEWTEAAPGASLSRSDLTRLTAYIKDNIERPIELAELAEIVRVSRFHFTRLFKRSTGMTAFGFVEQCRIRRAQSLILETDIPLAEVAVMAGFADQSHFTRRFHRHTGCTPAAFAREKGRRRQRRRRAS